MADLILRPSGLSDPRRAFSLQLRHHGPVETDYHTIARVSRVEADAIIAAGGAYWLFGEPKDRQERDAQAAPEMPEIAAINRQTALRLERAELVDANRKAVAWGAGVGARDQRIAAITAELAAMEPRHG